MEGSARVGSRMGTMEALPLPPPPRLAAVSSPSPAASIRAHLARAAGGGGGVESCQSPRSLLSRILQRGDGGGSGGKFGCRVRLPRRYSSTSAAGAGGGREEAKDTASEQDAPARVKVVGRAPELSLDTPRSSCTLDKGRNGKKKQEEEIMSMNLGLGASLVLLLSKGAVELNKMVELRAQMEALVSEIRKETQSKQKDSTAAAIAVAVEAASSSQESDGRSTTAVKDPIARAAVSDDAMSNCSGGGGGRAAVVMHRMEAELQVELSRLQCAAAAHGEKRAAPPMHGLELPLLQVKTTKSNVSDSPPRSCVVDEDDEDDDVAGGGNGGEVVEEDDEEEDEEYDEEEEEEEEYDAAAGGGDKSPPHGGVSARALERRLYELLQKRQQERIVELEAALDTTQRRLHEKEREVVWWRDAAKLVTHRRDESRRFARS